MQTEWLRYSCQMKLPQFGADSQRKLQQARVLIIGVGGLGCPAAQYLAAAGIGTLGLADFDSVSVSNLHRQILYTPEDVGLKKAVVAAQRLQRQNPQISVVAHDVRVNAENIEQLLNEYDLLIDGTDNFETRYLLNDACVMAGKPLVYGAIYQYEGHVAVWNVLNENGSRSSNYRDVFPKANALQIPNCAEGGVIPTLAGIIGCMQANEALKYFTNSGDLLAGKMLLLDVQTWQTSVIKIGAVTKTSITALAATETAPAISVGELQASLQNEDICLIDVRTKEERLTFNIGGEHIPLADLEARSFNSDRKSFVLYCASGQRSAEAVKQLSRRFPGVKFLSLAGGLRAWQEHVHG